MTSVSVPAQTLINDGSGTVHGSLCVGDDCNYAGDGSENFGFDTYRLKENNIRIHFEDTSNSASFPGNDWRITINSADNGGGNFFSIDDATTGRAVLKIEAGAPADSLRVDSGGRVGIGTHNPVEDVHTVSGDTPTLRLEQDGSSGFVSQTWDVAGNEGNFFVRDVTNGSRLPFKIKPGAPTDSIFVGPDGDVGIGFGGPSAPLHVRRTDDTAEFLKLESAKVGAQDRAMMYLENYGGIRFEFRDLNRANGWRFQAQAGGNDRFEITKVGSGEIEYDFRPNGNLIIAGNLFTNSDVNSKQDIVALDSESLLTKLDALPVSEWSYKDATDIRHVGPMAQDFHAQFGLGEGDTSIAPMDLAGVSLAAVKAVRGEQQVLKAELVQKNLEIGELKARLETLEALILQKTQTVHLDD